MMKHHWIGFGLGILTSLILPWPWITAITSILILCLIALIVFLVG